MDHSTRRLQKTHPDAYPTSKSPSQDGLPFGQDETDVQVGPGLLPVFWSTL